MIINYILKILMFPFSVIIFIPALLTTNLLGIIIAIPVIDMIYITIMTAIWLPFYGLIFSVSWLYQNIRIMVIPLSLIGIPFVIIIDVFLLLMPNPDREDKQNKATICGSYPFSTPSRLAEKLIPLS
jgi:hypothetical protein